MARNEYRADPQRWDSYGGTEGLRREYQSFQHGHAQSPEAPREEVEEPQEEEEQPEPSSYVLPLQRQATQKLGRNRHGTLQSRATSDSRVEKAFMDYLDRHPTAIKRVQDHRLQHAQTVGTSKFSDINDFSKLPPFGGGKPYPPNLPEKEEYVVEFDGPEDPVRQTDPWKFRVRIRFRLTQSFLPGPSPELAHEEEADHLRDSDTRCARSLICIFGFLARIDSHR